MAGHTVELTPPEHRLSACYERADALSGDSTRLGEEIELRQECFALAQLACRDDGYQLAQASAALASAYLRAGSAAAAARHAGHATGLLIEDGSPAHTDEVMASSLLTLACALANSREYTRALECFPRAVAASERARGPRHASLCPLLRAFARMVVQHSGDYALAEGLLAQEREIRLRRSSGGNGGSGGSGACGSVVDGDVAELEQEMAVMLMRHAKLLDSRAAELRLTAAAGVADGGRRGAGGSRAEDAPRTSGEKARGAAWTVAPGFVHHAPTSSMAPAVGGKSKVGAAGSAPKGATAASSSSSSLEGVLHRYLYGTTHGSGGAPSAEGKSAAELTAIATRKRQQATRLLKQSLSQGGNSGIDAPGAPAATAAEARLAAQLAAAHKDLGQWAEAEAAYLRAIPFHERTRGASDPKCTALWGEVVALRMKLQKYGLAASDCTHLLEMARLVHGPDSAQLIPIAERLCKAHVLARRWGAAREALTLAYDVSVQRLGDEHKDTERIAEVLRSLDKYAPPQRGAPVATA